MTSNDTGNNKTKPYDLYSGGDTGHCTHAVYLCDNIDTANKYTELVDFLLNDVKATDIVNVVINNTGGCVSSMIMLMDSFKRCPGVVNVRSAGHNYSAAAVLSLGGESLELAVGSFLMFHNYSGSSYGKGRELVDQNHAVEKSFNALVVEMCTPFLTKKEVQDIVNDKDVYVHYNDVDLQARIHRHFKTK